MATATGAYATATALKALVGITDSTDDTLIGLICDRVNQYIESTTRQVISPITSAAYTYDVEQDGLRRIFLPYPAAASSMGIGGIRSASLVEIAPETGGTFETIASGDYFLRGKAGVLGPYRWLVLSDLPAGSYSYFPKGMATVRVTGTAGWTAIPDDVTEMANEIARRAWNARQNVSAYDEAGQPFVPNYVSGRDRETLRRYTVKWAG